MTIDEIYRTVRVVANKEQRGFLKPSEFNLLADRAQMEMFTQRYNNIKQAQLTPINAFSINQKSSDDLRAFVAYDIALAFNGNNDAWDYPNDYIHILALSIDGIEVEVINEDKLLKRINSSILAPSVDHPIGIQQRNGFVIYNGDGGNITAPATQGVVNATYLIRPTRPLWAYEEINGNPIYNPSNSTDFEFPEQTHNELTMKVLSYLGIHIREGELAGYATNKEQTGV